MKHMMKLMLVAIMALSFANPAFAANKKKIDKRSAKALQTFYQEVKGGKKLLSHAAGYLIFPKITKAGIGLGGEKGDGKLVVDGKTKGYYRTVAGSVGFQLGVQTRSQILVFMNDDALDGFLGASGWEVGVDGSVALVELGAGGAIDTSHYNAPILAFVFSNKGLMYNLTIEGSKISKID